MTQELTEILPRLFEKFATKSEAGTGLGLYISKKRLSKLMVEKYGLRIIILMIEELLFILLYL